MFIWKYIVGKIHIQEHLYQNQMMVAFQKMRTKSQLMMDPNKRSDQCVDL